MSTLSVCIVTKNESHNIVECLNSVSWANEIIIVDSESTDNTVELCKKFTDKITIAPWAGCGPQKKHAVSLATSEWVLILDADERVTPLLKEQIQAQLQNPHYDGFKIPFCSYYCNKQIRFGDWSNESHLRLFKKSKAKIIPRVIHFRIELDGTIGKLTGKIKHFSYPHLESVIKKMNTYSSYGALHKYNHHKKASIFTAIGHGLFTFIRSYILKLGFLDGKEGFMLAFSNAEGSYYKYAKLIYMGMTKNTNVTLDDIQKRTNT